MKRKLSLLLAVVVAMTMVMGIGVTAFAAAPPGVSFDEAECTTHSDTYAHYYSFGTIFDYLGEESVKGIYYGWNELSEENVVELCEDDDATFWLPPSKFPDGYTEGWYYRGSDLKYHLCDGHGSVPTPPGTNPEKPSAPAHVHKFEWQIITNPTKDTDGLEGEMCSCGAMRNTEKISAYAYSLYQYAMPMINNAKSGQTITFEFGEWNSFPKAFMEKIAAKSMEGVTFVFRYKWNHEKQEITIPFGTAVDTQFDWYGPAKMAELYGMN